jgi:hypothetical protein
MGKLVYVDATVRRNTFRIGIQLSYPTLIVLYMRGRRAGFRTQGTSSVQKRDQRDTYIGVETFIDVLGAEFEI